MLRLSQAKGAEFVKSQKTRLEGMMSKPMTAQLKQWLVQRYRILEQLAKHDEKEEL